MASSFKTLAFGFLLIFTGFLQTSAADVTIDVNDISFLFQVPKTGADAEALIALDSEHDSGEPIMPKEMFADVMTAAKAIEHKASSSTVFKINIPNSTPESSFEHPHNWKVAGIRVHPSSLGTSPEHVAMFGSPRTVRLIVQPVTVKNDVAKVHDYGAHVVFAFPDEEGFRSLLRDLVALKRLVETKTPTNVPLSIHPGITANVEGFKEDLRALVMKHLSRERLQIVSFMGIRPPEPWIFFAMSKINGRLVIKDLGKDLSVKYDDGADLLNGQMLILIGGKPVTPTLKADSRNGTGMSTAPLFEQDDLAGKLFPDATDPKLALLKFADIPDVIANPNMHHNRNTDCVSCHTETALRRRLGLQPSQFAFKRPEGVSGVDEGMLPENDWNVHNFGWFPDFSGHAVETVTQRTANEAAASADFINKTFPEELK